MACINVRKLKIKVPVLGHLGFVEWFMILKLWILRWRVGATICSTGSYEQYLERDVHILADYIAKKQFFGSKTFRTIKKPQS